MSLQSPAVIAHGRFELLRLIGSGGMGHVFHAVDRELETEVALKMMRVVDPTAMFRFKNEFRALAEVHHLNLVQLYELVADGDRWFFTMELLDAVDVLTYVRGVAVDAAEASTASVIADGGEPEHVTALTAATSALDTKIAEPTPATASPPNLARLRNALHQLAAGVQALHASGHLHRDIKPSNVLVTSGERVVLVDFGITTTLPRGRVGQNSMDIAGTPAYMAPEQASPTRPRGKASDWYSVGVILYEALAGRRPFTGTTDSILRAKAQRPPPPPSTWREGVDPELERLCLALLDPNPEVRPGEPDIQRATRSRARTRDFIPIEAKHETFVGREWEIGELHALFAVARGGHGAAATVSGLSGMGKSALVERFLQGVSEDATVLVGRCYERESVPYKALDSLVDSLCQYALSLPDDKVASLLPLEIQAVATAFPVLRRVPAIVQASRASASSARDPIELRRRAFSGLRALFATVASIRPLVLHIDDLQWGDVDSASLLNDLVRGLHAPILFIGSYRREDENESALLHALLEVGRSLDQRRFRELRLERLSLRDAKALTTQLLGAAGGPTDCAERLAHASGGNPFLAQELVRYAVTVPAVESLTEFELEDMIVGRVARLPADARRIVELVALAGKPIPLGVVRRAAAMERALPLVLAELRQAGLIRTSGNRDADPVETFHDRVREAVSKELDVDARAECHRQLAREIESAAPGDSESLARHYAGSGDRATALHYARKAATAAAAALAFERAAKLFALARELAGNEDVTLMMELAWGHGEALTNAGRAAEAAKIYEAAADTAPPDEAVAMRARAGAEFLRTGHLDHGFGVLRSVLEQIDLRIASSPWRAVVSALYRRLRVRLRGLRYTERLVSEVPSETLTRVDAHWKVSGAMGMVDTVRGADAQAQHVLLALGHADLLRVGRALSLEIGYACLPGVRAKARVDRLLREVADIAERTGDRLLSAVGIILGGLACYQRGEFEECLTRARDGERILRSECAGATWEETSAQLYWTWALYWSGDLVELRERAAEFVERARERGDLYAIVSLTTGVPGFHFITRGQLERARTLANQALMSWGTGYHLQHYWANFTHVSCHLYEGQARSALALMDDQIRALRRSFLLKVAMVRFESLHLRGRCALAAATAANGRHKRRLLARAQHDARRVRRMQMGALRPLGTLLEAGVARQRGQVSLAHEMLEQAESSLRAAGVKLLAAAAAWQLGKVEGGAAGRERTQRAEREMREAEVLHPDRVANLLVPGFTTL